jgi:hypothetical protein
MRHRPPLIVALGLVLILQVLASAQQLQVRLVSLTSPVGPGNDATIAVQTVPNASCGITVIYKSGPSRASGLVPKTSDIKGNVSWTWRVGTRTTPGKWPITVSCSAGGQQGRLETVFVVG